MLEGFRIFFGALFILFVPGFAWSYVFFAKKNIDWIERVALSIGLSIALVPLTIFWLNWLFDIKITLLNTSLVVCGLTGVALVWVWARRQSRISRLGERVELWFKSLRSK
ncbi:MAG: hypothetical protein AMJ37_01170 [Dehalococcoidia bacterium DG_18]|nr:MAG: hypothetical protein AMJ37_01170 [Dehalococcoidia bacterium DG_18]